MSTGSIPPRPHLEYYRKQAKRLLKAARRGDAEGVARMRRSVPRFHSVGEGVPADVGLHDAQLAVARENGFASWPQLHAHVIAAGGTDGRRFRPHVRKLAWYEERVAGVISVQRAGLPEALAAIRRHHPRFAAATDEQVRGATFTEEDARLILAREHGFERWADFKAHIEAIEAGLVVEPFAQSFDAIQAGDLDALTAVLQEHLELVNAQGTNGSSLLNLASSLRRPAMCRLLLDMGADVDLATTRGITPLHQAAYSNQAELIDMFIEAGASPEMEAYGEGGTPLVMALFWGHDAARDALARYAIVPANLRVAAGVGRLDLVQACFQPDGSLTEGASARRAFYRPHTGFPLWTPSHHRQEVLDEALAYAARNGAIDALEYLLARGANINGVPYRGTALIWATYTGRSDVVRWLLTHGADINQRATFGGPQHGQGITALHAAADANRVELVRLLLEHGADPTLRDDLYQATALGWAEHHGHEEVRACLQRAAGS